MKRIEFIAPVEAMRGNLSGTQTDLEYPAADNKAYESPVGSTNYARNYRPSFIGAKRAKDGLKYFAVKTKSAIHLTAKSKRQMALLGGAGAIIAAILRDKSSALYIGASLAYTYQKTDGKTEAKSMREWLTAKLVKGLSRKMAVLVNTPASLTSTLKINNPWVTGGDGLDVPVTSESLVRFWNQLANAPIEFNIDGQIGVAHDGDDFETVISSDYNVLGLSTETIGGSIYVKQGTMYVKYGNEDPESMNYAEAGTVINPAKVFILTDVAPEP